LPRWWPRPARTAAPPACDPVRDVAATGVSPNRQRAIRPHRTGEAARRHRGTTGDSAIVRSCGGDPYTLDQMAAAGTRSDGCVHTQGRMPTSLARRTASRRLATCNLVRMAETW